MRFIGQIDIINTCINFEEGGIKGVFYFKPTIRYNNKKFKATVTSIVITSYDGDIIHDGSIYMKHDSPSSGEPIIVNNIQGNVMLYNGSLYVEDDDGTARYTEHLQDLEDTYKDKEIVIPDYNIGGYMSDVYITDDDVYDELKSGYLKIIVKNNMIVKVYFYQTIFDADDKKLYIVRSRKFLCGGDDSFMEYKLGDLICRKV